jgi:hypothetical protein
MHKLALALLPLLSLGTTAALAHHKPGHHIPPGHLKKYQQVIVPGPAELASAEMVCFVTTVLPGDPDAEVVSSEWLPRGMAEEWAAAEGGFIIIHPDLEDAESCEEFFWE